MKVREGEMYTDYVQAGKGLSAKLDAEGYNYPMSTFVVETNEIAGLSAEELV